MNFNFQVRFYWRLASPSQQGDTTRTIHYEEQEDLRCDVFSTHLLIHPGTQLHTQLAFLPLREKAQARRRLGVSHNLGRIEDKARKSDQHYQPGRRQFFFGDESFIFNRL